MSNKKNGNTDNRSILHSVVLDHALELTNDFVFCLDSIGRFSYTNPRFREIFGYSEKDLARLHIADILPADHWRDWQKTAKALTASQPFPDYRTVLLAANGNKIFVSGTLLLMSNGPQGDGLLAVFENTTRQEETTRQLKTMNESLNRRQFDLTALKSFSDRLTNVFTIDDAIHSLCAYLAETMEFDAIAYLIINPADFTEQLYGIYLKEPVGNKYIETVTGSLKKHLNKDKDKGFVQSRLAGAAASNEPSVTGKKKAPRDTRTPQSEIFLPLDAGNRKMGVIHISSVDEGLYENGAGWVADSLIVTFILALVRLQTLSRAQQSRTETLIESLTDGFIIFNDKMDITLMNPASLDFIGLPEKDFTLKNLCELFPEYDILAKAAEMLLRKTTLSIEEAQLRGRFFEIFFTPIRDNNGRVVSGAIVLHDITHLKEIDRLKSEFVSIASHQLRTPLTGIKWFTRLLILDGDKNLTARQKDFIKQIHDSTLRMIKLVKDLLDVSHIETGRKFEIVKNPATIKSLMDNTFEDCEVLGQQRSIKLKAIMESHRNTKLNVDSGKIRQAFNNLVNNAIKYSHHNGRVDMGYRYRPGKDVIFYVKDRGLGIPKSQQSRMFEKFFRADNVKLKETKGSGLGMYIAKAIIEAHEGKIWFESEENKGTTFYFYSAS